MSRALMFWCALLLMFLGAMMIFLTRGYLHRRDVADEGSDAHHAVVSAVPDSDAKELGEPLDFTLTDQKGRQFASESLQGKIWVGSIFYASCPSTCRLQNTRVAELQQRYGDRGVEFVSVTCDPNTDTPSRLNDYSKMFGAEEDKWHFLTGDLSVIKRIGGQKFGIPVEDKVHSDRLILFDRQGQVVGTYRSIEAAQFAELTAELDRLLDQPPTEEEDTLGADEISSDGPGENESTAPEPDQSNSTGTPSAKENVESLR